MNKRIKLFLILLIIFLIPGCAKYSIEMKIDNDKSVTIEIITAVEEGYEEDAYLEEDREAALDKGFSSKDYYEDDYIGYILTKKYSNIDDISSDEPITVELRDIITENKDEPNYYFYKEESLFKTTYVASFTIDTTDGDASYLDSAEYKVTLPTKATNSNATKTSSDGKTLTWDLTPNMINKINYEFQLQNSITPIIMGCILGLCIVSVIVLKAKNNNNNIYNNYNNQPMYPNNMMYNNINNTNNASTSNIAIGNMDAADVSMKENYINNMLPTQTIMYNNMMNNNIMYPTSIVDMYQNNLNQNNIYTNNDYSQNNLTNNNQQYEQINNQYVKNTSYEPNNNIIDDTSSIDKPNLNNNYNNIVQEEKHYELSSNKDIFN